MAAVTHARNGSVSVVTLDDGKVNAFDDALIDGIHAALDEAADSRAVVLAGRDGVFSGGFDLAVVGQGGPAAEDLVRRGGQLLVRLYTSPVPVVAACTGHAVALGAVVLLAADLRIGSSGAFSVGLNEVGIGMPVPPLLLALAEQRLNAARRTEAVLLARLWTPEQAVEVGFLDDVVEVDDVLSVSVDHAKRLGTALQPDAFRVTSERMRARVAAEGLSSLSAPM
jgi:enoyl-CoA hydratase